MWLALFNTLLATLRSQSENIRRYCDGIVTFQEIREGKLLLRQAMIYRYLDKTAVRALASEHLDGKQNRRLFIRTLLNVECRLRENFK